MTSAAEARVSWAARLKRREQAKRYRARCMKWAHVHLAWLIETLGGKCAACGDDGTMAPLSVDHVKRRGWDQRALRFDARVKRYWEEHRSGVQLQVLCIPCNSRKQ